MGKLRRPARAVVPYVLGGVLVGAVALGATVGARPAGPGDEAPAAAAASPAPSATRASVTPPRAPSPPSSTAARPDLGDLVAAALARAEPSGQGQSGQGESAETGAGEAAGASGDSLRAPCAPSVVACVQVSTQHFWMVRDGRVVRDGFVSSGTADMATPTGMFTVQWKSKDHVSTEYRTPMPYAVFFDTRGDALHEGALGMQSRGCVRLEREDAKAFFDVLQPGDGVQILA